MTKAAAGEYIFIVPEKCGREEINSRSRYRTSAGKDQGGKACENLDKERGADYGNTAEYVTGKKVK